MRPAQQLHPPVEDVADESGKVLAKPTRSKLRLERLDFQGVA
jgi:hypothetical protein